MQPCRLCIIWAAVVATPAVLLAGQSTLYDFERAPCAWRLCPKTPQERRAQISCERASRGRSSMRLEAEFPGDVTVEVRPNADWAAFHAVAFDVFVPTRAHGRIQLIAYVRDADLWWYQTMPVEWLESGTWQTITLDVSPQSGAWEPRGHMKAWSGYVTRRVRVFGLRFFSKGRRYRGPIYVDNVRGIRRARRRRPPFAIQDIRVNAEYVRRYGLFEISFRMSASFENPFDPDVVSVEARFVSPKGEAVVVPGFFYQNYQRGWREGAECLTPVGPPEWKIRFAPTQIGRYSYRIAVRARGSRIVTAPRAFEAVPSNERGFVRVSRRDWRYFEFDNGEPFYPIGHNAHAPFDFMYAGFRSTSLHPKDGTHTYDRILPKMAAHGENFVEIWMSPWAFGLEWNPKHNFYHGLGRYNLQNAWKLDYVLSRARELGIYVHLVIHNHGQFSLWVDSQWANNPYNRTLGGFLDRPDEYFISERAVAYFQKLMRYILARWGYATNLFGLELWSELDLTGTEFSFLHNPSKRDWHEKVLPYIRRVDPWRTMITSHYSSGYYREDPKVVSLPGIDYAVTDGYRTDLAKHKTVVEIIRDTVRFNASFHKPCFITEFGGRNSVENAEVLEADLHCGLWGGYMSHMAATPLFWWFHFIEDRRLYFHYKALSNFHNGLDRRAQGLTTDRVVVADLEKALRVRSLANETLVLAWVYHRDLANGKLSLPTIQGATLTAKGLRNGRFKVEWWDTWQGTKTDLDPVEALGGNVRINLPPVRRDAALKLSLTP